MRFSKLRLTGFKSFVDPTDLIIADGLTGVVGPNGCGKSNLLEALRWVMGENRPKAMRGGGMEDVIFAGAATRPARNFAEVSLLIDNLDRLAPAGFNDSDSLEVIRRITRDVGSAYKANAKDVRARDVQMLFADASTGAHSPSLVRQGQISELINAKPTARRRILEEAAGISGLYQRRHEAELKLKAAEANLLRVDDVLDQLSSQLNTLARQARQATRYREIGAQLRRAEGLLMYRRWAEAEAARAAADVVLRDRTTDAARAEALVQQALKARAQADAALPPLREEETISGAVLQRLQVQQDTLAEDDARATQAIDTLTRRIAQMVKDIDRETGLNRDAGDTIARLQAEAQDLAQAGEGHDTRLADAAERASAASDRLQAHETALSKETEDVARLAARHQSARRFHDDSRKTLTRAESEETRASEAMRAAKGAVHVAGEQVTTAEAAAARASETAQQAEEALTTAEELRAETQTRESTARAARSEAEGEASALRAEAQALAKLVARDGSNQGQILDELRVDPGFEKALGAALTDDLRAPVVAADGPSGWTALPGYDRAPPLPAGAAPLSDHVQGPQALQRRLQQIGIVSAEEGARLQAQLAPGQRLVTRAGDLWRWDGLRNWAEEAPSQAALRLEQRNRLEAVEAELGQVSAKADSTRAAHDALVGQLAQVTAADKAAREARRKADQQVAETARALSRAEGDLTLAKGRLENLSLAVARHKEDALAARAQLREAEAGLQGLGDLDAARAQVEGMKQTVEAARISMMTYRAAHDELRREGEARAKRAQAVAQEIDNWQSRLDTAGQRLGELQARKQASEAELLTASAAPAEIAAKRDELTQAMDLAQARCSASADALAIAEVALRDAAQAEREAERQASDTREARAGAEARLEAARETVTQAAERISESQELTPNQLLNQLDVAPDQIPAAQALESEVAQLRRKRDGLGSVNLRADEDAREIREEFDTLSGEKADLEEAIKTLRGGISGLNREGRERLITAFEQVNSNFAMLFKHLFGGGEANLVMVQSDDPLEAGLEIMCQPPGKKLSTLSLLSGGEQTLTALALIFAVFLANPAPICVLDEVDAPLDDANVTRFCDLLDEMCRQTDTRFLIITHHAVTMSRMDRLFGVTMAEQGVSQLVSVDLKKAEAMVA